MAKSKSNKAPKAVTKRRASTVESLKVVGWFLVAVAAAVLAVLVAQVRFFNRKVADSYATAENDPVEEVFVAENVRKALKVHVEPETHPNPKVRGLPEDLSRWPPGERGVGIHLVIRGN